MLYQVVLHLHTPQPNRLRKPTWLRNGHITALNSHQKYIYIGYPYIIDRKMVSTWTINVIKTKENLAQQNWHEPGRENWCGWHQRRPQECWRYHKARERRPEGWVSWGGPMAGRCLQLHPRSPPCALAVKPSSTSSVICLLDAKVMELHFFSKLLRHISTMLLSSFLPFVYSRNDCEAVIVMRE